MDNLIESFKSSIFGENLEKIENILSTIEEPIDLYLIHIYPSKPLRLWNSTFSIFSPVIFSRAVLSAASITCLLYTSRCV